MIPSDLAAATDDNGTTNSGLSTSLPLFPNLIEGTPDWLYGVRPFVIVTRADRRIANALPAYFSTVRELVEAVIMGLGLATAGRDDGAEVGDVGFWYRDRLLAAVGRRDQWATTPEPNALNALDGVVITYFTDDGYMSCAGGVDPAKLRPGNSPMPLPAGWPKSGHVPAENDGDLWSSGPVVVS